MDIITTNKVDLIRWLRCDGLILQHVQSKKLITADEYFMLDHIQDSSKQITKLLDLILTKGLEVCNAFLELLKDDKVNESMPELRNWITTVKTSSASSESNASSNPAQGDTQKARDNQVFLKKNYSDLVQKIKISSEIADMLTYFSDEQREMISAEKTEQNKMRMILRFTNSKKAADLLFKILSEQVPDVMEELSND